MTTVLDRIKIVLEGDTVKLTKSLLGAQRAMQQAGQKMQKAGKAMTTRLTLPLLGIGVASTKIAADFDASMRKIVGLVGVPVEQVNEWREDVRHLGVEYGISAKKAADALFFITSAGLRGATALETLQVSLQASAAGMGDVVTVADAATSAMNAYGEANLSATRATEILTAGVRKGKLEAAGLAPVMGRITGTAAALNVSFEDVVGTLAVFSRTGTQAAEGATQVLSIMSSLLGTSREGEEALTAQGLSLQALRDIAAKPGGLLAVMRLLNTAFEGNQEALKMVIPNLRAFRGVMNALAQDAAAVDDVMEGVTNSIGIVDAAFEASKGPLFLMRQAFERFKESLLSLGNAVIPVVLPLIIGLGESIEDLTKWFDHLSDGMKKTIVVTAGLVAATGPLLLVFGSLLKMIATIQFVKLFSTIKIFSGLLLPGGVLLVGLGLLAAAFFKMRAEVAATEAAMLESTQTMKNAFALVDPKLASARVERLNEVMERLQERADGFRQRANVARIAMIGMADATRTKATPALIENADALLAHADGLEETITQMAVFRDVMLEMAKVATTVDVVSPVTVHPSFVAMQAALVELGHSLRTATDLNELLGASFDLTEARAEAYKEAILAMVTAGVPLNTVLNEEGETLQDLADMFGLLTWSMTRTTEAQEALMEAEAEAALIVASVLTPVERYDDAIVLLDKHLEAGRLTQEQYSRAVTQAQEALDGVNTSTKTLGDSLKGIAASGIESAFNKILTGTDAATSATARYKEEVGRLRKLLQDGLLSQENFNEAVAQLRTETDGVSNTFREWGNVALDVIGSIIQEIQRLGIKLAVLKLFEAVGAGTIEGFATGGFMAGGQLGLVGERGPELVRAGRGGVTVQPLHSMSFAMAGGGSGGDAGSHITVQIQATDARSFTELIEANPGVVIGPVVRALQRSDMLRRLMR